MIVDELKKSILNEAITGKLIKSNLSDNSVKKLYKELIDTSEKFNIEHIDTSAMDFIIPENWCFIKLNNLFNFIDYRGKTPNKIKKGINLITATNIKSGYLDLTEKRYISKDEYLMRQSRGVTKKGDILFTTEAPLGHCCINNLDVCSTGQRIITFQQHISTKINNRLFCYFILSDKFQQQLTDNATGTTAQGIKASKLKNFIIPLPPIEEQQRIVDKIEELFAKLDKIKPIEEELINLKLSFPNDMKKAILSYLYKDTDIVEKKKIETIVNLENIKKSSSGTLNYLDVKYLRTGHNNKKVKEGKLVKNGDMVLLMDGENAGELFKIEETGYLGSTLKKIALSSDVLENYFIYYLQLKKDYFSGNKKGAAIPHLNKDLFFSSKIYLPSIEEQQKIVDKIEELLPLCDDIEKIINN